MTHPRHCVHIVGATHVGLVRESNEDAIGQDDRLGVAVLADGMGGHRAGEIASTLAVSTILNDLALSLPDLPIGEVENAGGWTHETRALRAAIENANTRIYQAAERQPAFRGMGTTVVAVVFYGRRVSIAHVGDSRLYRVRQGQIQALTQDHSAINELIARGYFRSMQEALAAGMSSNAITRALGQDTQVRIDLQEAEVTPEDIYLLCSDGLTDTVEDATLLRLLTQFGDLNESADQLITLANRNGGNDNTSVILIRPHAAAECAAPKSFTVDELDLDAIFDNADTEQTTAMMTPTRSCWQNRWRRWIDPLFRKG